MKPQTKPKLAKAVTAAAEPEPAVPDDSAMVCLIPSPDLAQSLAVEGGQPPESLHVTLVYLGKVADLGVERADLEAAISEILAEMASVGDADTGDSGLEDGDAVAGVIDPDEDGDADTDALTGVFNGIARFAPDPDQGVPIVTTLDAPGLGPFRDTLAEALRVNFALPDPTHGLVPHMTLLWDAAADPSAPLPLPAPSMAEVTFTEVCLAWGDVSDPANVTRFPLDGSSPAVSGVQADGAEDAPGRVIPEAGPLGTWEACLVTEGVPTDEFWEDEGGQQVFGRLLPEGVVTWREPPLPGGFAMDAFGSPADNGHGGAPTGLAATKIWRDGPRIMASGPYLGNAAGAAAKAAVDSGAPVGPSIDLGGNESEVVVGQDGKAHETVTRGTITGFCVLPFEAMHAGPDGQWLSWIRSVPGSEVLDTAEDAEGGDEAGTSILIAAGLPETVAIPSKTVGLESVCGCGDEGAERFGAPLYPPKDWLYKPPTGDGMPLTVTAEGQIWGYAAGGTCHVGIPGTCVKPSDGMLDTDYSSFHKGLDDAGRGIQTAEGEFVQVGQITLSGGHADSVLSAAAAKRHYDETRSVIANVRLAYDPQVGAPFMAGALVYGATKADVQTLRAVGHVSVDYRRLMADGSSPRRGMDHRAKLRLIGLPVVPVGGFPPVKSFAANGQIQTWIETPQEGDSMAVIGETDLPIADRDRPWDGAAAQAAVAKLCGGASGELGPACFSRAFLYRDDSMDPTDVTAYKLGFADVVNGELQTVYAGVAAAAGRLDQTDMSQDDTDRVQGKIRALYDAMRAKFDDPTVVAPFDQDGEQAAQGAEFVSEDAPAPDAPADAIAAPAEMTPPETPPPGVIPYAPEPYAEEASETTTCPRCGRGNDPDASFCDQCGQQLTPTAEYTADPDDTIQCPECQAMVAPDAGFCDQCGTQLTGRLDTGPLNAAGSGEDAEAPAPAGADAVTAAANVMLDFVASGYDRQMEAESAALLALEAEQLDKAVMG